MTITAEQKLSLYNGALAVLGETRLLSGETRKAKTDLDEAWNRGVVDHCLEAGNWSWATRDVRLDYDPDYAVQFGYLYAYQLPSDFLRVAAISANETLEPTLEKYRINGGYLFCNLQTVYLSYVSDDDSYGWDFTLWPEHFKTFVEEYLAYKTKKVITGVTADREDENRVNRVQNLAASKDGMNKPVKRLPQGGWSSARLGGSSVLPSSLSSL